MRNTWLTILFHNGIYASIDTIDVAKAKDGLWCNKVKSKIYLALIKFECIILSWSAGGWLGGLVEKKN